MVDIKIVAGNTIEFQDNLLQELLQQKRNWTLTELCELDISDKDKVYLLLRNTILPEKLLAELACQFAEMVDGLSSKDIEAINAKRNFDAKAYYYELAIVHEETSGVAFYASLPSCEEAARAAALEAVCVIANKNTPSYNLIGNAEWNRQYTEAHKPVRAKQVAMIKQAIIDWKLC